MCPTQGLPHSNVKYSPGQSQTSPRVATALMVNRKDRLEKTGKLWGVKLYFSGGYVDFGGL